MDLSGIPQVDAVLCSDEGQRLLDRHPRGLVAECARRAAERLRDAAKEDAAKEGGAISISLEEFVSLVEDELSAWTASGTARVVNATGVVLHTNLGRAVLPERAVRALAEHAPGYSLLEVDLASGKRDRRGRRAEELLCRLTGAEAALVVNNNAAATVLVLSGLARGGEVLVSRGQLIEIGGAFRLPDIMAASGARLVEVGATNRTYLRDYESAVSDGTALIMHVHTSNYAVVGFSCEVPVAELVKLGRERDLPVVDDLGSGALVDTARLGVAREPLVRTSVDAGVSLVTFSTDKLVGGPQGGAIVGRRELVDRLRKHPLARAFRAGKLTLIALEATLELYLDEKTALRAVPALGMLDASAARLAEIRTRALAVAGAMEDVEGASFAVTKDSSELGGGALPGERIPTWVVAVSPEEIGADELAARLRSGSPPVFGRIKSDRVLLDMRTVLPGEDETVAKALKDAFAAGLPRRSRPERAGLQR